MSCSGSAEMLLTLLIHSVLYKQFEKELMVYRRMVNSRAIQPRKLKSTPKVPTSITKRETGE